ncbi:metal-dependent hydrolase [Halomarina litorea]|uniref:metal-dependent hydrolase n=1 Tax=Halomarina litorea TaxID=2961595 RepID=UPI0020C3B87F|nr:metal-dependent hydrolase [Halomarina sp. BCD28]
MMVMTHVLVGIVVGGCVALLAPEAGTFALLAGALGGAVPDLDLYAGHRKTLHFPVYGPLAGVLALAGALAVGGPALAALAAFLLSAGLHASMDVLGGGLELKPWRATSERAVYSHYHGRWLPPRRLVPYDGAPADLLLAGVAGLPALAVTSAPLDDGVTLLLVAAMAYTVLRKRLADLWAALAGRLPPHLADYLPERFAEAR